MRAAAKAIAYLRPSHRISMRTAPRIVAVTCVPESGNEQCAAGKSKRGHSGVGDGGRRRSRRTPGRYTIT